MAVRRPGEAMTVRLFPVEDESRILRTLDADAPEVVLDGSNETMLQGVVVFRGRAVWGKW